MAGELWTTGRQESSLTTEILEQRTAQEKGRDERDET